MNREYHVWHSPSLNRNMELLVFGHSGSRVLVFPTSMGRYYEWEDRGMMVALGEHIERGWIQRAETVGELADQIGLDSAVLTATVERYNEHCRKGVDADFGRSDGLEELKTAPFYAIKAEPCLLNTQGGPRRDAQARVLDVFGEPIPGLYAAGELGSIWSTLYPGSGNISEALIFGRIAGREAAQRTD